MSRGDALELDFVISRYTFFGKKIWAMRKCFNLVVINNSENNEKNIKQYENAVRSKI